MERNTPVRKPHTSTSDLLTWSEVPQSDSPSSAASAPRSSARSHQPSDGIRKVVFGGQVTDEETDSLNKRKPCSDYKMKEMSGSGIFSAKDEEEESEFNNLSSNNKTGIRMYQQAVTGISHISFGEEDGVSPKKPSSLPEVAKQRELTGNLDSESDAMLKKQLSDAKSKELSGHDIFAPPPDILPRPHGVKALALKESIDVSGEDSALRTAKKICEKKFSELSGNDIFKGDVAPSAAEKSLSVAKLKEMSGSDIFADVKVEARDYLGGVRKPPGGESTLALV